MKMTGKIYDLLPGDFTYLVYKVTDAILTKGEICHRLDRVGRIERPSCCLHQRSGLHMDRHMGGPPSKAFMDDGA